MSAIQPIISTFVSELVVAIEEHAFQRVLSAVAATFGTVSTRRPGRPQGSQLERDRQKFLLNSIYEKAAVGESTKKPRKKRAKQLCPVPGCKGVAAPIFGMVCGEHRKVAKSKIAKYRSDRKIAKRAPKAGQRGQVASKTMQAFVKKISKKVANKRKVTKVVKVEKAVKVAKTLKSVKPGKIMTVAMG